MKLKKIAALALAGVMAVSMLAGCSGKGTETSDLSAAVVAGLSADTTKLVKFTAVDNLSKDVAALMAKYGTSGYKSKINAAGLAEVDGKTYTNVTTMAAPEKVGTDSKGYKITADGVQNAVKDAAVTATFVKVSGSSIKDFVAGSNAETVAKAMAGQVDATVAYLQSSQALSAESNEYTITDKNDTVGKLNYTYTGTVSVYTDTDAATGVPTYYLVYTITRAASPVTQTTSWN